MGIFLFLVGIMIIFRLRKTYFLFKNPIVQKGILYHLICVALLSVVHVPEPAHDLWEEERKIEKAVTMKYLKNHLESFRFGEVNESTYASYLLYLDSSLNYEERQELNRQKNAAINKMYDSRDLPDIVYAISEKLTFIIIILWLLLSFAFEPMRKALVFALSIISIGLLFNNNGRDDFGADSNSLKEDPDATFVDPHYVDSHAKQNGIHVDGYWRDGDGDTSTNQSLKEGGGYWRSHPDGSTHNNLKS